MTHDGLVKVREARLYTRPRTPPLLFGAAVTDESAAWVATWADGLITVARPEEQLKRVVERFREGGGEGKPMLLQAAISFASGENEAEMAALESWRTNAAPSAFNSDTSQPEVFDAIARFVRIEDLRQAVRISADPERHVAWLDSDRQLGFERIHVHHVGKDQLRFIEAFAEKVLPACERR